MLKKVLRDNQEPIPVVFSQASECLQMIVGVEVEELDSGSTSTSWSPHWASPGV